MDARIFIPIGLAVAFAALAEAGIKFFLIGVLSSAVMLYGMSLIYGVTGKTNIYEIAPRLGGLPDGQFLIIAPQNAPKSL